MEEKALTIKEKRIIQNQIITQISNIELWELDENKIPELVNFIIEHLEINKFKKAIYQATEDLSSVTSPTWYADMNWIAQDNQKRLEIIHGLLRFSNNMEIDIRNIKKAKKEGEELDQDYLFQFLLETQKLCKVMFDYMNLKSTEVEDSIYMPNLVDKLKGILTKEDKKKALLNQQIKQLDEGKRYIN